jgi:hypothetical protein
MARQGKTIFSSFSGNIANIQGALYNNKGIIKSKPKKTTKTLTPALQKTRDNLRVANRIYDDLINRGWGQMFKQTNLPMTSRQFFIGKIITLLNRNVNYNEHIEMLPNSINYDRMTGFVDIFPFNLPMSITYNLQPRLPMMLNNDKRLSIRYYSETDELIINNRTGAPNRGTSKFTFNWTRPTRPGERRLFILMFISDNWKNIYMGHTISITRP